jgi:hypothetical protein
MPPDVITTVAVAEEADGDGLGEGAMTDGGCAEPATRDGESVPAEPQAVASSRTQQITPAESSFRLR